MSHGARRRGGTRGMSRVFGPFYLVMAGINVGLVVADPDLYASFADAGLLPVVRDAWESVVMAHPAWWIGALAAGELAIGLAFLGSRPWRRAAYGAAVAFHVALLPFGWGVWAWAVPALALLGYAARRELGTAGRAGTGAALPVRGPADRDVMEQALVSELGLDERA